MIRSVVLLAVVPLWSCADDGNRPAAVLGAVAQHDRAVMVFIEACHGRQDRVGVAESAEAVLVLATTDAERDGDMCSDGVVVTLDEPLGDRYVIDGASGDRVDVTGRP